MARSYVFHLPANQNPGGRGHDGLGRISLALLAHSRGSDASRTNRTSWGHRSQVQMRVRERHVAVAAAGELLARRLLPLRHQERTAEIHRLQSGRSSLGGVTT